MAEETRPYTVPATRFGNTPITVDAVSEQDARDIIAGMSDEDLRPHAEQSLRASATRIGMTDSQGNPDEAQIRAILGTSTPSTDTVSNVDKFFMGARRTVISHVRGVNQVVRELMGDEEGAKAIAQIEADEKAIFDIMDKENGWGWEDIGQLAPELLAFMVPGLAAARGVRLIGTAALGGFFGGTQVQDDPENSNRTGSTIFGVLAAGAIPGSIYAAGIPGRVISGVSARVKSVIPGVESFMLRGRGLAQRPQATQKVVDSALDAVETTGDDAAAQASRMIGEAALFKVNGILRATNPPSWVRNEATMAGVQRAISQSTKMVRGEGDELVQVLDGPLATKLLDKFSSSVLFRDLAKPIAREVEAIKTISAMVARNPALTVPEAQAISVAIVQAPRSTAGAVAAWRAAPPGAAGETFRRQVIATGENVQAGVQEGLTIWQRSVSAGNALNSVGAVSLAFPARNFDDWIRGHASAPETR